MTPGGPIRVDDDHEDRYPGADRSATECIVNLLSVSGRVEAELDRLFRQAGLTGAGVNVLMILEGAAEPLSPGVIGERLLVTRGTVTGLVDTLEKEGRLRRRPNPDDRRSVLVELTDDGLALIREVMDRLFPAQAEMTDTLSAREKETLIRLLGKLGDGLAARSSR